MLFWIATAVLAVVVLGWIVFAMRREYDYYIHSKFWFTPIGKILTTLGQLVLGFVAWFVLALIFSGIATATAGDYQYVSTDEKPLVALQTRDSVNGNFRGGVFASYGSIDGKRVISYVTKAENGGIRTGTVDADEAVIYEEDGKPRMETLHWEKRNDFVMGGIAAKTETYVIYVPVGSLVENYEVAP